VRLYVLKHAAEWVSECIFKDFSSPFSCATFSQRARSQPVRVSEESRDSFNRKPPGKFRPHLSTSTRCGSLHNASMNTRTRVRRRRRGSNLNLFHWHDLRCMLLNGSHISSSMHWERMFAAYSLSYNHSLEKSRSCSLQSSHGMNNTHILWQSLRSTRSLHSLQWCAEFELDECRVLENCETLQD